jgi:hypothetical protein
MRVYLMSSEFRQGTTSQKLSYIIVCLLKYVELSSVLNEYRGSWRADAASDGFLYRETD